MTMILAGKHSSQVLYSLSLQLGSVRALVQFMKDQNVVLKLEYLRVLKHE